MTTRTGHCLCAGVRFETDADPLWTAHCHCESCRRATASPFTTFLSVPRTSVRWIGTPARFGSSPGVSRLFCPTCGSPLGYETARRPDDIDLYLALMTPVDDLGIDRHDFLGERHPCIDPLPVTTEDP